MLKTKDLYIVNAIIFFSVDYIVWTRNMGINKISGKYTKKRKKIKVREN